MWSVKTKMKNNKKIQKSKYKTRIFERFIFGLVSGFALGYFLATPFTDSLSFGLLACAGLLSGFSIIDHLFWYFRSNKNERKKSKK